MALRIITADERLQRKPKVNIALFGPSGVGKTTQARTLNPETTLFLDGEAGTLALADWRGDVVDLHEVAAGLGIHPWEVCRAFACLLAGPDMSDYQLQPNGQMKPGPYAKEMFDQYKAALGDPAELFAKYDTIFLDSITVASRWSFSWANTQPDRISDKGKIDKRGAYGLHSQEMIKWLTTLQHIPGKSIIVVGILDKEIDDLKRVTYTPQIEGSKAGRELPGIFDQVITLENMTTAEGQNYRAFVCHQGNEWGLPAKDRSGRLDMLEEPNLGKLLSKISTGQRIDQNLTTSLPPPPPPPPAMPVDPAATASEVNAAAPAA